jgi:type I restriction enzyme S subunit
MKRTPKLRFPEFSGEWEEKKCSNIFEKVRNSVDVEENKSYKQIGIRSHGKGIFYKDEVTGKELGNKRVFWVEPNVFIVNIVFAWEMAIARTTENEIGMIASHRFPMYKSKEGTLDLNYITYFFNTNKGKALLELASPGGAGRNKTLGQKEFDNLNIILPKIEEQKKISSILSILYKKIQKQQEKIEALKDYKNGILQKIFLKEIRFYEDNGKDYPDWEEVKIKDIFDITRGVVIAKSEIIEKETKTNKYPVFSSQTSNNGILGYDKTYDFQGEFLTWTTDGANAGKIFKRSGCFRCTNVCGVLVEKNGTLGYANRMIAETLNRETPKHVSYVGNPKLMNGVMSNIKIVIPCLEEQQKISKLLENIDKKIQKEQDKFDLLNTCKKGLLQQMFV